MYNKVSIKIIIILVTAAIVTVLSSGLQVSYAQPNQDMRAVLDLHNRERALVGFPPLTWSNSLAAEAQNWANHLATLGIVCGPQGCQPPVPHGANNENIALGYVYPADVLPRTSPAEYAQRWADEKVRYNAGQRTGPGIGHYTAMVWRATSEVGCGFVAGAVPDELGRGGGTDFLVCRYNPPGNIPGQGPSNLPNYSTGAAAVGEEETTLGMPPAVTGDETAQAPPADQAVVEEEDAQAPPADQAVVEEEVQGDEFIQEEPLQ
jgi:pathogenesis-related protein 1